MRLFIWQPFACQDLMQWNVMTGLTTRRQSQASQGPSELKSLRLSRDHFTLRQVSMDELFTLIRLGQIWVYLLAAAVLKLSCMVHTAHKLLFSSEAQSGVLECHNSTQGLLLKNNTMFKHVLKTYPSCNYTCFWREACDFMHTWLLRLFLEHAAVH